MNNQFILQNDLENTKSLLALSESQLRDILDKIKNNVPPESIKGSDGLDKLFDFSVQYEAKILASKTVGNGDRIKQQVIDLVEGDLAEASLLQDFLSGKNQISERDLQDFNDFRVRLSDSVNKINETAKIVISGSDAKLRDAKNYSSDKLLRIITRSVAIDPDFDRDLGSFLTRLVYEVNKDEQVLPLILKNSDKDMIMLYSLDAANSQAFRDQTGGSLTPLVKQVVGGKDIKLFDDSFKQAYSSVLKFMIGIYTDILTNTPELRRTPQEVEEIKNELLSDIELPDAPVAPTPPPTIQSQGVRVSAEQVKPSKAPTVSQTMPVVPRPPMPPKPPINSGQNIVVNTPNPLAENSKDIQPTPNASIAPNTPTASQNKGNVAINKIERPAPPKDNVNPIQRIDLE